MNTNRDPKKILIYGDSITWGRVPGQFDRHPEDVRFTGVTRDTLGEEFEIIEEGLRSRMVKGENPYAADYSRDGYTQFEPILSSHLPLDMVIVFLGTNDSSFKTGKTAAQIVAELEQYKSAFKAASEFLRLELPEKIAFVAPPVAKEVLEMFSGAEAKMKEIAPLLHQMCVKNGYLYFNSNDFVEVSDEDGVHLDAAANKVLGEKLARFILENM